MNDPQIAYNNTKYVGYSTPHTEARDMLDEEIKTILRLTLHRKL